MAQLALDDPTALKKLLGDCAVPATIAANLELLGYRFSSSPWICSSK